MDNNEKMYGKIYCEPFSNIPEEWKRLDNQGRKFVRVCFDRRKNVGNYGETHNLRIIPPQGVEAKNDNRVYLCDLKKWEENVQVREEQPHSNIPSFGR